MQKYLTGVIFLSWQAEQQKQAAIISAEGDSQAALLIANSLMEAGDGLVELRKLEAAEDIAFQLSRSRNITYLPSGQGTLLQLPQWWHLTPRPPHSCCLQLFKGPWKGWLEDSIKDSPNFTHTHSSHSFSNQLWTGLCCQQHGGRQSERSEMDAFVKWRGVNHPPPPLCGNKYIIVLLFWEELTME